MSVRGLVILEPSVGERSLTVALEEETAAIEELDELCSSSGLRSALQADTESTREKSKKSEVRIEHIVVFRESKIKSKVAKMSRFKTS